MQICAQRTRTCARSSYATSALPQNNNAVSLYSHYSISIEGPLLLTAHSSSHLRRPHLHYHKNLHFILWKGEIPAIEVSSVDLFPTTRYEEGRPDKSNANANANANANSCTNTTATASANANVNGTERNAHAKSKSKSKSNRASLGQQKQKSNTEAGHATVVGLTCLRRLFNLRFFILLGVSSAFLVSMIFYKGLRGQVNDSSIHDSAKLELPRCADADADASHSIC